MQLLLASVLFAAAAVGQQYEIDPNSVSNSTRQYWCTNQESQCPLICLQTYSGTGAVTLSNTCDYQSLTYSCVCGNGLSPNVSEYSETLPFFVCQEWGVQCQNNCGNDNACQAACVQDHPCGAQHPTRVNLSTVSTSSMASTATGGATGSLFTGFAGASPTATTGNSNGHTSGAAAVRVWALSAGQTFGSLGVAGALFGGFALLL